MSDAPFKSLAGHYLKEDIGPASWACDFLHDEPLVKVSPYSPFWGANEANSVHRVRVWAPRLNLVAWVRQAAEAGIPTIKWFHADIVNGERNSAPYAMLRVKFPRTTSVNQAFVKPSVFCGNGTLLRCGFNLANHVATTKVRPGIADEMWHVLSHRVDELHAPLDLFVSHLECVVPENLLRRVNEGLDMFASQGARSKVGSEASVLFAPAAQQLDEVHRDLIDPELCLAPCLGEVRENDRFEWQAADLQVDNDYRVTWLSWVNHIRLSQHAALLTALADLFALTLPQHEQVIGQSLHSRRLQVVVRAYERELKATGPFYYKTSNWCKDGQPNERIITTSICYVWMDSGLHGGALGFTGGVDATLDDAESPKTICPSSGSVVVFNNAMLCHHVGALSGVGRYRVVAFHLVDPEFTQRPAAMDLPRHLSVHGREELWNTLSAVKLPLRVIDLVVEFAVDGATAGDLLRRRDEKRLRRMQPIVDASQLATKRNLLRSFFSSSHRCRSYSSADSTTS